MIYKNKYLILLILFATPVCLFGQISEKDSLQYIGITEQYQDWLQTEINTEVHTDGIRFIGDVLILKLKTPNKQYWLDFSTNYQRENNLNLREVFFYKALFLTELSEKKLAIELLSDTMTYVKGHQLWINWHLAADTLQFRELLPKSVN